MKKVWLARDEDGSYSLFEEEPVEKGWWTSAGKSEYLTPTKHEILNLPGIPPGTKKQITITVEEV